MNLIDLPQELFLTITGQLDQKEIKSLRLVWREFKAQTKLHIKRAFVSPNRVNIDAFLGIISHEEFKHDVQEVI